MRKCRGPAQLAPMISSARARYSAAWATFWNLQSQRPLQGFPNDFGPDLMTIIGVNSEDPAILDPTGVWFEPITPANLVPKNLYEAQLALRRSSSAAPQP